MRIIYGVNNIKRLKNPVVAMGVFDGVHRGHQKILRTALKKAHQIKGTSVVLTFWPHPQEKESLYSLEHRLRLIAQLGLDVCVVINFSKSFSRMRALDFAKNILGKKIGARFVYTGENFRFGRNAEAGLKDLAGFGASYGFKASGFGMVRSGVHTVSSTVIRRMIKEGDLSGAQKLLGRRVSVLGTVIKGVSLATKIGFPTANIDPHHEVIPPPGIYAVRINFKNKILKGACYIGTKPTINAQKLMHVEVHIFDFGKNIYGEYLDIQFVKKLRQDKKFASLGLLASQIKNDISLAKKILSAR